MLSIKSVASFFKIFSSQPPTTTHWPALGQPLACPGLPSSPPECPPRCRHNWDGVLVGGLFAYVARHPNTHSQAALAAPMPSNCTGPRFGSSRFAPLHGPVVVLDSPNLQPSPSTLPRSATQLAHRRIKCTVTYRICQERRWMPAGGPSSPRRLGYAATITAPKVPSVIQE